VNAAQGNPGSSQRAASSDSRQGVSLDSIPAEVDQQAPPSPHAAAAPRRTKVTLEEDPAPAPAPASAPARPGHPETVQLDEAHPVAVTKPLAAVATAEAAAVSLEEQEVPEPKPAAPVPAGDRGPLNRGAALSALAAASGRALACSNPDGPSGSGRAMVTFSPDGPVTNVSVPAPFAGTSVGSCVSTAFRGARVPAFTGSSVTLPQSFRVP
jgi:hypothetical protein